MRWIAATCCICCLLLSAAVLRCPSSGVLPSVGTALADAEATRTELMQQSDHHRRVERAKKVEAEAEDRQIAAFGIPEAASRDYDYLVLIMLAASVVVLAFVARRRRHVRSRP